MIAYPQRLPLVVWRNSRLVPLSERWLVESIHEAAGKAGYPEWELAPHIARAIAVFLEEEFNRNTITLNQLQDMLAESIDKIGFPDVAKASVILSPKVSISLLDLARRSSLELFFFPMLHQKIEDAIGYEASGLIFEEIRPCVKVLHQARRWKDTCEELRDRIVDYIRFSLRQNKLQNLDLVIV
jgi:hypothetical protein